MCFLKRLGEPWHGRRFGPISHDPWMALTVADMIFLAGLTASLGNPDRAGREAHPASFASHQIVFSDNLFADRPF